MAAGTLNEIIRLIDQLETRKGVDELFPLVLLQYNGREYEMTVHLSDDEYRRFTDNKFLGRVIHADTMENGIKLLEELTA